MHTPLDGIGRVAVIHGGYSHEANYSSARWIINTLRDRLHLQVVGLDYCLSSLEEDLTSIRPDVVFPQTLGSWGEDGTLQAILDRFQFPYVGSGILASAVGINKSVFGSFVRGLRLVTSHFQVTAPDARCILHEQPAPPYEELVATLGSPFVLKPLASGASFGVTLIPDEATYRVELPIARSCYTHVLVERYVQGHEYSIGILENDCDRFDLPIAEVLSNTSLYSQEQKLGSTTHRVPPTTLDQVATQELQQIARGIFLALGCRSFARLDVIVSDHTVFVLEINTLPGLIPGLSMFPDMCQYAGISYDQMLCALLKSARREQPMMVPMLTELPPAPAELSLEEKHG